MSLLPDGACRTMHSPFIRQVRRLIRRAAVASLAAGLYAPTPGWALVQSDMSFPYALTPAFRWAEPIEMRLSGVPVVVRSFVAASSLEQVARTMARHEKFFQRVTTLPGSILLSGVHAGRHWVAQLESEPGQVKGMVSALPLHLNAQDDAGTKGSITPWLTQNASLVFGQSSTESGRTVVHSMHLPDRPLDDFVTALGLRLAQRGWRRSGAHSWLAPGRAKPAGTRRIDVFPVQGRGMGAVFVSQSD